MLQSALDFALSWRRTKAKFERLAFEHFFVFTGNANRRKLERETLGWHPLYPTRVGEYLNHRHLANLRFFLTGGADRDGE